MSPEASAPAILFSQRFIPGSFICLKPVKIFSLIHFPLNRSPRMCERLNTYLPRRSFAETYPGGSQAPERGDREFFGLRSTSKKLTELSPKKEKFPGPIGPGNSVVTGQDTGGVSRPAAVDPYKAKGV